MTKQTKDADNVNRSVKILNSAIKSMEFAFHEIEHNMGQWPHTQKYEIEQILIKVVIASLKDKVELEK